MNAATDEIVTGLEQKISYLSDYRPARPDDRLVGTIWG